MATPFKLKNKDGKIFFAVEIPGTRSESTDITSSHRTYIEGMGSLELQDGTPLNELQDGTFQNALTGEVLTRA
jgi:hypothetical protein